MSKNIDPTGDDGSNKVTKYFSESEQFSESLNTPSVLKTDGPGEDLSAVSGAQILLSLSQETSGAGGDVGISCLLMVGDIEPPEVKNEEQTKISLDITEKQLHVPELSSEIKPSSITIVENEEAVSVVTTSTDFSIGQLEITSSESDKTILCCRSICFKACGKSKESKDLKVSENPFAIPSFIRVTPSSQLYVSNVNDSVKIRMVKSGPGSEVPITVHQMFKWTVEKFHNRIALAYKVDEYLHRISYLHYYEKCRETAKGFLKLGLERYHGVGIVAANCPEWFFANVGAIMAGGLPAGIYMTNAVETYQYFASKINANILVVENYKLVEKIRKVRNEIPNLKAIVQIKLHKKTTDPDVYTWRQLIELGINITDEELDDIIESQHANQCCLISLTSGTTGIPKGVMISHDNITWTAYTTGISMDFGVQDSQERLVSYLPLSHITVQMIDLWIQMAFGGLTYFANVLQGSLVTEMREVEPTMFKGVPHVWEKFQEDLEHGQASLSPLNLLMQLWARKVGSMASNNHMNHCGKVMEGCKIRIDKMDENLEGEVCLWGRNIFMGYLNMVDLTKQAIDSEGWLHTEDLGLLNNEGFLYLTGRIKELIILTNGIRISPIPIEKAVEEEIPIISHAMLTAVKNDLVILLTLKCGINEESGRPSDILSPCTIAYLQRIRCKATTVTDVIQQKDSAIYNAIQNGIDNVNKKASSITQNIKSFIILKTDFSISGGELGPMMKLRRQFVEKMYEEQIDQIKIQ